MSRATVVFNGSKSWANNLNDLRERWKLRREEPVKFTVPVKLFKQDIEKLSKEDLLTLKLDLQLLNHKAKIELRKAAAISKREGTQMMFDEYQDLFCTQSSLGVHLQEVNHALSAIKEHYKTSLIAHFFDVCRELLSKDEFMKIMDEANDRARGKK